MLKGLYVLFGLIYKKNTEVNKDVTTTSSLKPSIFLCQGHIYWFRNKINSDSMITKEIPGNTKSKRMRKGDIRETRQDKKKEKAEQDNLKSAKDITTLWTGTGHGSLDQRTSSNTGLRRPLKSENETDNINRDEGAFLLSNTVQRPPPGDRRRGQPDGPDRTLRK